MKYLQNDICEFKCVGFNIDPTVKKNIVSISFFKIYGGGYKDFNLYINGFKQLHKLVLNEKKYNFWIRLFIDNSIYKDKELRNLIENLERVEIVIYSCEKYLDIDTDYHIGLFGTIIRFFPMFDFPNNDANIVMISDMDDYIFFKKNIQLLNNIDNDKINKIYMYMSGNLSKNIKFNHDLEYKGYITPYCISSNYISFKRIEHNLIINFFYNFDKNDDIKKIVNTYGYKINNIDNKIKAYKKYIYGVDEHFLNFYLKQYLIDNKKPFAVNVIWDLSAILYYYEKNRLVKNNKKIINLINYIVEYLLDRVEIKYDKNSNFYKKYKILDDILYGNNEKLKFKINNYYYKMFLYFYNNSNYKFLYPKELYEIIKSYNLFGIYSFECIIYYNIEKVYSIQFIKKNIFDKDQIKKLKTFAKSYTDIY